MTAELPRRLLGEHEVATALADLHGWQLRDDKLQREFVFANFVEAIGFIMRAAIWAEHLNHHPDWSNVYKTVRVQLWSHDLGGVSAADVELARKMNELAL